MEQSPIYNAINFSFCGGYDYGYFVNSTGAFATINSFLCPSDPNAKGVQFNPGATNYSFPPGNNSYRGSIGTTTLPYNTPGLQGFGDCRPDPMQLAGPPPGCSPYFNGVFGYWLTTDLRDITDGSSNTVAFAESLCGNPQTTPTRGNAVMGVNGAHTYDALNAQTQVASGNLANALNQCTATFMAGAPGTISNVNGVRWGWGSMGITLMNTVVPPSSTQYQWNACRTSCPNCSPDDASYSNAQSNHPGGANVMFADGSVRFLKSSISQLTYMALGTRAGGEVVSADQY